MDKVALEFSRRYIVKKYVRIWQDFVIEERLLYWDKENRADEHNDKYVYVYMQYMFQGKTLKETLRT